jgi:CheY-like chemotaxis protein
MSPCADVTRTDPDADPFEQAERRLAAGELDSESSRRAYAELLLSFRANSREQRRLLEATLASLTDGIAIFDARGCLRFSNQVAARLLDAPSALKRRAWRYADLAGALIDAGASIIVGMDRDTLRSPSDEIRFPDGRVVQIRRTRMTDGGEIHVYVDVTAERQRGSELDEARAASTAAASAQVELLAVMSHEIHASIGGMLDAARRALGLARDPKLREPLEAICQVGEAAAAILDDVLAGAARAEPPPQPAVSRPLSILLAEDDPVSQLVGVGLLERFGHRVELVGDGQAAVEAIASGRRFDVVLMDLFMPNMDGIAATRAIRALPDGRRDVPIVALTASPLRADIDAALAAGMRAAIAKPLDAARLDGLLAQVASAPPVGETETTDAAPPDCDGAVMRQLHGALGEGAVRAAMRSFLDAMEGNAARLEAMLPATPAQAASFAHRLAGSAAVFGFRRLSRALLEIEEALRAGELGGVGALLKPIPDLASAALQRLSSAA